LSFLFRSQFLTTVRNRPSGYSATTEKLEGKLLRFPPYSKDYILSVRAWLYRPKTERYRKQAHSWQNPVTFVIHIRVFGSNVQRSRSRDHASFTAEMARLNTLKFGCNGCYTVTLQKPEW